MKTIAITPRVYISEHGERFEALAQQWAVWLNHLGYAVLPLCLHPDALTQQLSAYSPDAVLLSGGNDIATLDGAKNTAPERDAAETHLIEWALREHKPLLGICRGMQLINMHFGGTLTRVSGHAGTRHMVEYKDKKEEVNSYHEWGIAPDGLAKDMHAIAMDEQGYIEAVQHTSRPIMGVMWHPEREEVTHTTSACITTFLRKHI